MANTFKTFTLHRSGRYYADVYTCPSRHTTTIIGLNCQHIGGFNHGQRNFMMATMYPTFVKSAIVPTGSSLVAVGGDQKIVMNATDILKVNSVKLL